MTTTRAFAAFDATSPLRPFELERREPGPRDVVIEIQYCGVCHSDLHTARAEWGGTQYPCVPGHEIVGRVSRVGAEVARFVAGARVGVGCMVDSCRTCASCRDGFEQYCDRGEITWTYNGRDRRAAGEQTTYGGYANQIVVDEAFCLRLPAELPLAALAPLLCAGVTTWSPLRHWGVGKGSKVGVVGLGGLGHMAVKLAHAFGAETVLFTTSPAKAEDARRLGADEVVISSDPEAMKRQASRFDLILDTVAASHDLDAYTSLLRRDATLVLLGVPERPHASPSVGKLVGKRRRIAGTLIGGIRETQEMLDFCAEHGLGAEIETIGVDDVDGAYDRVVKSDVRYRFVIDLATF
jgi:uncharacterized zinc-type alcohol dehydrogenase-like protein